MQGDWSRNRTRVLSAVEERIRDKYVAEGCFRDNHTAEGCFRDK